MRTTAPQAAQSVRPVPSVLWGLLHLAAVDVPHSLNAAVTTNFQVFVGEATDTFLGYACRGNEVVHN